jgi:hypothetical protein
MPHSCHIVAMANPRIISSTPSISDACAKKRQPQARGPQQAVADPRSPDAWVDDVYSQIPSPLRSEDYSFGWWAQLR